MKINLGKTDGCETNVTISEKTANLHFLITGISGTGKTVALQEIETSLAHTGGSIVVLNYNSTHHWDKYSTGKIIHYSVRKEGFPFPLLQPIEAQNGQCETPDDAMEAVLDAFNMAALLGIQQKALLRDMFRLTIQSSDSSCESLLTMEALEKADCEDFAPIMERYRNIFQRLRICEKPVPLIGGEIYDIDFSGYDTRTQSLLAELALSWLWRYAQLNGTNRRNSLFVVCDEFQNLNYSGNSTIAQILREGRKQHLFLLLATQTLADVEQSSRVILNQAGTRLFFRPTEQEIRNIAQFLDCRHAEEMCGLLRELQTGECLAKGKLCAGNVTVERALKIAFSITRHERRYGVCLKPTRTSSKS